MIYNKMVHPHVLVYIYDFVFTAILVLSSNHVSCLPLWHTPAVKQKDVLITFWRELTRHAIAADQAWQYQHF